MQNKKLRIRNHDPRFLAPPNLLLTHLRVSTDKLVVLDKAAKSPKTTIAQNGLGNESKIRPPNAVSAVKIQFTPSNCLKVMNSALLNIDKIW